MKGLIDVAWRVHVHESRHIIAKSVLCVLEQSYRAQCSESLSIQHLIIQARAKLPGEDKEECRRGHNEGKRGEVPFSSGNLIVG